MRQGGMGGLKIISA